MNFYLDAIISNNFEQELLDDEPIGQRFFKNGSLLASTGSYDSG